MSFPESQLGSGSGNPSVGVSFGNASGTVLARLSQTPPLSTQSGPPSPLQSQVDGLVTHFVDEAANPRTLAALMAGGMAYRFGRIGVMGLGESHLLRPLSVGVGLGTEVTAFEGVNRSLATLSGDRTNPNLWRWYGQGGWAQGLLSSTITFSLLKGAGVLGREQNFVFQHAFQSTAMVAGHNMAGLLGISPRPEGTLAEQLLHAEATNLQLGAGVALSHSFAPGVQALERSLDLSLQARERGFNSQTLMTHGPNAPLATAVVESSNGLFSEGSRSARDARRSHIMMMTGGNEGGGDSKKPSTPPTPLDDTTPRSPGVEEEIVSAPTIRVDPPESGEFDNEPRTAQDEAPPEVRFHPAPAMPPQEEGPVPSHVPVDLPAPIRMVPTMDSIEVPSTPESVQDENAQKIAAPPPAVVVEGELIASSETLSPEELAARGVPVPKVVVEDQYASSSAQARLIRRSMRPSIPPSIRISQGAVIAEKYRIVDQRPLGAGGFGEVWRAEDIKLGRQVALKVIKRERLEGEDDEARLDEYIRRFEREIKIGANLDPQHSATVYEILKLENGTTILVMELLSGHDLSSLRNGISRNDRSILNRFPMERRLEIFAQICEALESAHRRGFVHMDLKPENIRVTEEGRVRIMDWGQAKGVGEATHHSSQRIPLDVLQELRQNLTMDGSISGTPGYIAPERFSGKALINPRSPDIFAMGVILYEWVTGVHPFAAFVEGDPTEGEPAHVAVRDKNGLTMISYLSTGPGLRKPYSLSQVMVGDQPVFLREVERIALKAMSQNPALRYQSAAEIRDDVILATVRAERDLIFGERKSGVVLSIREQMKDLEKEMQDAWSHFSVANQTLSEQWDSMHEPMNDLIEKRAEMHQRAEQLVTDLTGIMPQLSSPSLAQKMIAEVSWRRLLHGGDRMAQTVREALVKRIRENDVPTPEDPMRSFAEAIDGKVPIRLNVVDFSGRQLISDALQVQVTPFVREKNKRGRERLNFREAKEQTVTLSLGELNKHLDLSAGYYAFEISYPGYATMRVPLHLRLKDVRESLIHNTPHSLELHLIPEDFLRDKSGNRVNMVIVHRGTATLGHDFFHGGKPLEVYSYPLKKVHFETFAVSADPISVREYQIFIESQLEALNILLRDQRESEAEALIERIRDYLPHEIQRKYSGDKTTAEKSLSTKFEGDNYHWKVKTQGDGKNLIFILDLPQKDASGDPILLDQPISAIPYKAAEAYRAWRSDRDGLKYKIISAEQKETISRNSFPWAFPWGNDFDPSVLLSRLALRDGRADSYPHPIGSLPLGQQKYRDFSIYGARDLLGNVREFTSTEGEPNVSVAMSGGSVLTPYGPYFSPSSRAYLPMYVSDYCHGAFRLVLEFEDKK